jgi:hypothetical protein
MQVSTQVRAVVYLVQVGRLVSRSCLGNSVLGSHVSKQRNIRERKLQKKSYLTAKFKGLQSTTRYTQQRGIMTTVKSCILIAIIGTYRTKVYVYAPANLVVWCFVYRCHH